MFHGCAASSDSNGGGGGGGASDASDDSDDSDGCGGCDDSDGRDDCVKILSVHRLVRPPDGTIRVVILSPSRSLC